MIVAKAKPLDKGEAFSGLACPGCGDEYANWCIVMDAQARIAGMHLLDGRIACKNCGCCISIHDLANIAAGATMMN